MRKDKYMKHTIFILGISLALLFTACSKSTGQEEVSVNDAGEITSDENMLDGNMEMNDSDDAAVGYEGEWYRTDVHFDSDAEKEFYTNSENEEMPDDELLSVEWEEIKALDIPEDMLAYWMVLNGKMPFVSYDEGNQEFYWDEYSWYYGSTREDDRERYADYDEFVLADLNNDGGNELILYYGLGFAEVFHYEDNAVYGFQSVLRHMNPVYTNGVYEGSDSAAHVYYSRLTELDKDGYAEETAAEARYSYVGDNDYEIGGISVSQEEYEEFQQNIEETGRAEDIPYVGLDACLLGGLSEEELYMVKHVEVLPMNDTPSYPMEPEIGQAYYDVLTGGKELVSVTDDQQRFYLDDYQQQNGTKILYFSIVDMDQDGIYEVVLSCSLDTTQILHYADGDVYSYEYDSHYGGYGKVIGAMSNQGIFEMGSNYENRTTTYYYGKIVSFTEDGCDIQEVGQSDEWQGDWYDRINDDRIRYHYFSKELIEQYFR